MFGISLNNKQPIYEQLVDKITKLVLNGLIEPNAQLPSVRDFATQLGVNPNTVQKAFTELERNGVAYSVNGKGRFVTDDIENLKTIMINSKLNVLEQNIRELVKLGAHKDEILSSINNLFKEEK